MKNKYFKIKHLADFCLLFFPAFILLCATFAYASDIDTILILLRDKIKESSQLILVTNHHSSSCSVKVYSLEKQDGKWKMSGEFINGVIGKNGFAYPGEKREGDGKTPSGIFSLERTFGYAESIATRMPYRQSLSDDVWIDDVNADDYNHWVKKKDTKAVSYENMRRNDNLYKYGLVIEYNTNPVIRGNGSAIFFHVWISPKVPTAGCVAVAENDIIKILKWLDPAKKPSFVMGTDDIVRRLLQ